MWAFTPPVIACVSQGSKETDYTSQCNLLDSFRSETDARSADGLHLHQQPRQIIPTSREAHVQLCITQCVIPLFPTEFCPCLVQHPLAIIATARRRVWLIHVLVSCAISLTCLHPAIEHPPQASGAIFERLESIHRYRVCSKRETIRLKSIIFQPHYCFEVSFAPSELIYKATVRHCILDVEVQDVRHAYSHASLIKNSLCFSAFLISLYQVVLPGSSMSSKLPTVPMSDR